MQTEPVAHAEMLIRKPVSEVFEAFIDPATEWIFSPRGDDATFVSITASGFVGSDDEKVAKAIDSMGGFSLTLASCKAFLEHGVKLNLVADHNPDVHVK